MPILPHMGDENFDYSTAARLAKVMDRISSPLTSADTAAGMRLKNICSAEKNLYIDTSSCFHKISYAEGRKMLRIHGGNKVLFARDHPMTQAAVAIDNVLKMVLTDEENQMIFYKNAEKLLKI